jgi:ubiquinone/menaquinone biosynthesis C-methylase UbiE
MQAATTQEGFESGSDSPVFLGNNEIYDDFYASIYDQLVQNTKQTHAKIALMTTEWKKSGTKIDDIKILDAGCGTGVGAIAAAKMGVNHVLGIDKSAAMIERAKKVSIPNSTLTENQKSRIEFRQGELMSPSIVTAGAVTHVMALYFTIYYLSDKDAFYRNMYLFTEPGGQMVIEVVNKHKFDPMLESSAPWLGFSLQKYSKERITESKVTFDKFDYSAKFDLEDPKAEFRETFNFQNGKVRRHRHQFIMPDIPEIVKGAQAAGWVYTKYVDLTPIGFEYAYLLFFRHP